MTTTDRSPLPEPAAPPFRHAIPVAALARSGARDVVVVPPPEALAAIRAALGLRGLRRVRLAGRLEPEGLVGWRFRGTLGASVTQSCVITLAPVATRIDVPVQRRWLAGLPEPGPGETEMPEDADTDPLGHEIDLGAVLVEALSLALPDYPRAPGARFEGAEFGPSGAEAAAEAPAEDAAPTRRPFAELGRLLAERGSGEEDDGGARS
ncbi:MAG: DUF177 domain-containing protein [Alphaproteobacteria bacterium]|nr:MAG: DUF177 domain-containing protein [Alphaproteobacteria bacterium]